MKKLMLATVAVVSLAGAANATKPAHHAVAPVAPAPTDPVHRLIRTERANVAKLKADKFAATTPATSTEESFSIAIHPSDGSQTGKAFFGDPYWTYDNGTLTVEWPSSKGRLLLNGRDVEGKGYRASNGFGAVRDIDVDYTTLDYVQFEGQGPSITTLEVPVAGPQARALTKQIVVVLEGTISAGTKAECETKVMTPTMDFLQEVHSDSCVVTVKPSRIVYRNVVTGEVLKTVDLSPKTGL